MKFLIPVQKFLLKLETQKAEDQEGNKKKNEKIKNRQMNTTLENLWISQDAMKNLRSIKF